MGFFSQVRDEAPMLVPVPLTREAEYRRFQLATWVRECAIEGKDFVVDQRKNRTYRTASLRQFVIPLLKEMNLEGRKFMMIRDCDVRLFSADQETHCIPINIVAGIPHIVDLHGSSRILMVGYVNVTHTDYLLEPEVDFLVVGRDVEQQG
ncbi:hypothetical protein N7448_011050 [Penicillium atrosanguineum]|nr:hypothetical protein N7448_011050 [Penicillium atrosanguineum]